MDLQTQGGAARGQTDDAFRLLIEGVTDYAIFLLDPQGFILTWNPGGERLKQYRPEEIIGKHFSVFYPPEVRDSGKPARELEEAERTGRFEDEGWRVRKDGTRFWANVVLTAFYNPDGSLRGFGKITRDLSVRKQAEERLRQSETRLRLLIESIHDYAVFMLDPDGRVATWNTGAERIKGYTAREIIGQPFTRFYTEADLATGKCEMELSEAARTGRFEDEGWRVRKDGSRFWANVVISAVRDESGKLVGFSKVTRDLTERRRSENERAARLAAEQSSRVKDEFLAMLGHELRNPLAPIVTALQVLKLRADGPVPKEQLIIERQVKHMVRLVDDLLDISGITRGKVRLRRRQLDLREVIAKSVETVSPLLEQRGHHFEVEVPPVPIWVSADEERLAQVFTNLLNNAAKYTGPGGHVAVTLREEDGHAIAEIIDDGIGISSELMPKIFDLFVQGEQQGSERAAGGLGIGLALVRPLVSLHGGEVRVSSPGLGGGSTFTVRLPAFAEAPLLPSRPPPRARSGEVKPAGHRILVVDDNRDALELVGDALRELGHEVRTAADGPEALLLVNEFQPDIAILDIGLPVIDGYELAVRLREKLGEHTPRLIALTGYGQLKDQKRSREAGFHRHLVKPVDLGVLIDALSSEAPAALKG